MSAQTSYDINTKARIHGSLSDLRDNEIVSRLAEGGDIGFGLVVTLGTDKEKQAVIGGAAPYGITVRDLSLQYDQVGQTELKYVDEDPMSLIRRGAINLACAEGCTPDSAVKYNTTTGVIGAGAPGGGEAALAGCKWDSVTAAGEVGVLRLTGEDMY